MSDFFSIIDTGTIALVIFSVFLSLYFGGTQRIFSSRHSYGILLATIILSCGIFIYLNNRYPDLKFQFLTFTLSYYAILLAFIKLVYKKLNRSLITMDLLGPEFSNKDFTFVLYAAEGIGEETWEKNYASTPSWLDRSLSFGLLIGPLLLVGLTIKIARG